MAEEFYKGGYFDGKYITLDYLELVAKKGNEPSRFAIGDVDVAFDRTGKIAGLLTEINRYDESGIEERAIRFLAQLDAWNWYCGEAMKRGDKYLLDVAVTKLILFSVRLILLENRKFFPYHKWMLRVLEDVPVKPTGMIGAIDALLEEKTPENIARLYEMVKNLRDWTNGREYSWGSYHMKDVEMLWMRGEDYIENI